MTAPVRLTPREREILAVYYDADGWVDDEQAPRGRFRLLAPPYPVVNAATLRRLHSLGLVEWRDGSDYPGRCTPAGRAVHRTGETITLEEVVADVAKLDPGLDHDDPAFRVAVVLLASAFVGPRGVAEFTGYDAGWVDGVGARLRASGIWDGETVAALGWTDEGTGGLAFWMDVNAGLGLLTKTPA